jgi:DNA-binding transcriptional ArsR family regulator
MSTVEAARPAAIFAALGDPTRIALLARLSGGAALSISALSADGRMTRQAVTKHLRALEGAGLVESRREGRETRFAYRPAEIEAARAFLDKVSARWDERLERLRAFVED